MTEPVNAVEGVSESLLWNLRKLGEEFGALGVALVAAELTDTATLIERLREKRGDVVKPGFCVPLSEEYLLDLPRLSIQRGGVSWPTPEAIAAKEAQLRAYNRWDRRLRRSVRAVGGRVGDAWGVLTGVIDLDDWED